MRRKWVILISLVCLAVTALMLRDSCRKRCELSDDFYIAADARETAYFRQEAASRLNDRGRAIVRRLLTRNLQGYPDKNAHDAILVLGVVGDASTIPQLEDFYKEN